MLLTWGNFRGLLGLLKFVKNSEYKTAGAWLLRWLGNVFFMLNYHPYCQ